MSSRRVSFIGLGLLGALVACSPSTEGVSDGEEELGKPPSGVGFVFVDEGKYGWFESCVATLTGPTTVVSHASCLSPEFLPAKPGGFKLYFVPANGVSSRSTWIQITKASRYQRVALGTLARASSQKPIPVTADSLSKADVGSTFVAPYAAGDVTAPTLKAGTTKLRAVSGQGMKAIFPTLQDWANAVQTGSAASKIVKAGPNGPEAAIWQRPLLNGYQSLARGANENVVDVATAMHSKGAPLLRKVGAGYELVAIDDDAVDTRYTSNDGRNAILATQYLTVTKDVAAFLGGAKVAENHCLGVPVNAGSCVDNFYFNCVDYADVGLAPTIDEISNDDVSGIVEPFCGTKTCVVGPSKPGSKASCQ